MTIIIVSKTDHQVNQHKNVASISLYDDTWTITFTNGTTATVPASSYYVQIIY